MDTPGAVCILTGPEGPKNLKNRLAGRAFFLKKISKKGGKPLEMPSGFMYNSTVVCLGMKR